MAFLKFVSFWVGFLVFLWPKVMNNHGVSKIRVFLGQTFGISLAQSDEMLKFHVVGELSCWGHKLEIDVLNFIPFCYWKGAKFMEKYTYFGQF